MSIVAPRLVHLSSSSSFLVRTSNSRTTSRVFSRNNNNDKKNHNKLSPYSSSTAAAVGQMKTNLGLRRRRARGGGGARLTINAATEEDEQQQPGGNLRSDGRVDGTGPPGEDSADFPSESSLYERLGGAEALEAAVDLFYQKNEKDDRINEMFENADIDALKKHQFNFLRFVFSKQRAEYTGKDIFQAHKDLILHKNLGVFHFDCVAENLVATLREMEVPEDEVAEAVAYVSPLRELFDVDTNPEIKKALEAEEKEKKLAEDEALARARILDVE